MSQWGVSVAGFIRPWTAVVHSVTNQVRVLPPEDFGRPWPLTTTVWPGLRPWLGVTLTTTPGVPACAGNARQHGGAGDPGQGDDDYGYGYGPPVHAEDLRTRVHSRGAPGDGSFHRVPRDSTRPRPGQRGELRATGRSANLNAHPFGGGVIGNTTGSGPVIEGSSPSPRAPAASVTCHGDHRSAPSSRGLGHHPLKVATRVRIPLGLQRKTSSEALIGVLN